MRDAPTTATVCGLEERAQRGDDGLVVALGDLELVRLRPRDRELHLHRPALEHAREPEADVLEDLEHRAVVGHDLGDEALDPDPRGAGRELLEQAGADAAALPGVGDGEGRFGERRVAQADVVREGDDLLLAVVGERAEEGAALVPVRLEHGSTSCGRTYRQAVEAEVEAPLREAAEEGEQLVRVLAPRRAQAQGAAVAEDDVDDVRGAGSCRGQCCRQWLIVPCGFPDLEQADHPEVDGGEGVADEGVEALVLDLHVEDRAAAGRHADGLDAALEPRQVLVHPRAVEDRADDVEVDVQARARRRRPRSAWSRPASRSAGASRTARRSR